ncbi:MAG TPA: EutN/CcmL family microcompartment protein [Pseudomonadota bacterium]|nr:EutN/CcmL family microcompartment protein [Pseudomonadota bacterium]HND12274.1 EutN/CcmL family microcompartment protein [Pseudomonadota bacterium]HNF99351.1 EutN/CcmL family microcompartment protein [Pseudomonadota bacterium]HNI60316.1 EutN/CcmL family microcompartment protein [Pseudomonadota bacterium]HNK47105.1 EutN/CcmL family microcompartment protein [Pseudomonadota bacterium]
MKLCRVLGSVVATAKHPTYVGRKLLSVQPLDEKGAAIGSSFLAVDDVQAGPGDVVLVMQEGNGVRQLLKAKDLPIRSLIVGIVDRVAVSS